MLAAVVLGQTSSYIALTFGVIFFLFACKYYFAILVALFCGRTNDRKANGDNRNGFNGYSKKNWRGGLLRLFGREQSNGANEYTFTGNTDGKYYRAPFVSIQLPFYNEKNVARRIVQACLEIDYTNYEVIVADDSRDETIEILKDLNRRREGPTIKYVHRKDRTGFKGGALQKAVSQMDPRTEYVVILDADFIPPPDLLRRFLWYFEGQNGNGQYKNENHNNGHRYGDQVLNRYNNGKKESENIFERVDDWFERRRIGVVQGYQLHHLNKNENWITKGVRTEFSGGYMIERVAQEFFGSMKMITGSVFMIRAEILRNLGWTHSITEDWDLTIRMYIEGYKVLYTPLIQAPAEIPTTIRALARQRMRWAEGHTFAVKKYFFDVLKSVNLTVREKLEFLYFAPYYLQSFFFLIGTSFWFIAILLGQHPWFWTATFGWCLILSNLFALPLMGLSGLYIEQTAREDYTGIFSFIVLSYVLTPFQAYAAIKGLLERDEGGWVRTLKTGSITNRILQVRVRRLFRWILPRNETSGRASRKEEQRRRRRPTAMALIFLILMSSLIFWVTASAISVPVERCVSTSLSLEYVNPQVDVNGHQTNCILTHPDFTNLDQLYTNSFYLESKKWSNAWDFYLFEPLEADYIMDGRVDLFLFLYSDMTVHVDVEVRIIDVYPNDETKIINKKVFNGIELGNDSPENSLKLVINNRKANKIKDDHSILIEFWFRKKGSNATIYLDYDSSSKNSKVDFPGMVMPESLLLYLILAPILPVTIIKIRERRRNSGS